MSVGFHFNLPFGLKPEVGGIKIVSHCLQTIHFPTWVAHSHFDLDIFSMFKGEHGLIGRYQLVIV